VIAETVRQLGPWSWLIGGVVLLALELLIPGNVIVWFGVAAILTGALALATDFGWQAELIVFIVLAVVLAIVGRRYFARQVSSDRPFLNERARRLVGGTVILGEPIADGHGRVRIDDTTWRVVGPDLPSGTRVRISGADGTVLSVEKAE
jgi:hypothetical protein